MFLCEDGTDEERWALSGPEWFDDLRRYWDDQRADADLPDADELFLADLCEIMPNLMLAHFDPLHRAYRVEFAGATVRSLLEDDLLGRYPERADPGTPLFWIGAGYAGAGRLVPVGIVQIRYRDLMATHLPYRDARGAVSLILTALARRPIPPTHGRGGNVVRFPDPDES